MSVLDDDICIDGFVAFEGFQFLPPTYFFPILLYFVIKYEK